MIGQTGGGAENTGQMEVELKPRNERSHVTQVIQELRRQVSTVPGINVFLNRQKKKE